MEAGLPKRKRRWYQFSMRTLLVVVTLAAPVYAYLTPTVQVWLEELRGTPPAVVPAVVKALRWLKNHEGPHLSIPRDR